jgi:glycosyltransferase EpsF
MMRVLHVIPYLIKGGAERLCLDMVRCLGKHKSIEVRLAVLNDNNEFKTEYPEIEYVILNDAIVPSIFGKWKVNITSLNKLIVDFNPDIIHSHLFEADFLVHYKVSSGITYFTHFHDNMHQFKNFEYKDVFNKKRLTELYEKQFVIKQYKKANNHCIAISEHTEDYLKKVLPESLKKNIHFLSNAIDISLFVNDKVRKPEKLLKLINIASFVEKKNHKLLVDIAIELKNRTIDFELVLVGDGPLKNEVKEYASRKGCAEQIKFLGNVNSVNQLLAEADIYVHTATYEPFGLVLIEAMAAGLPVVCLDGGGNKDIIEQGKNGYILTEQNSKLFVDDILKLYTNQELYTNMSAYAKAFVKKYDINNYTDKLIELYNLALKN